MQQIKTFFRSLVQSIANPQYYNDILKASASFSWKYFFVLNFLLSLLILVQVVPPVYRFDHTQFTNQVVDLYPDELEVTFSPEGVKINQELPYAVPFPEEELNQYFGDADYQESVEVNGQDLADVSEFNLITFTTDEAVGSISDFYAQNSLIVLTETSGYIYDDADTGEVRAFDLTQFEETFTFNATLLDSFADEVLAHPFFSQRLYVPLIAFTVLFLFLPMTILLRILAVAMYSTAVWLAGKLFFKSRELSYGDVFQMGLHLLTLPMLVKYLLEATQVTTAFTGFWFFAAYLAWALLVLVMMDSSNGATLSVHAQSEGLVAKKSSSKKTSTSTKKSSRATSKKTSKKAKAKKG